MNGNERWQHYLPAIISFVAAYLIFVIPFLAQLIIGGALMTFGLLFSFVIYRIHRAQDAVKMNRSSGSEDAEFRNFQEPSFKNVTVYMVKKGRLFEKE